MTVLESALSSALAVGLIGMGAWACYVAIAYQRPKWEGREPSYFIGVAMWWVGASVVLTLLLALAGTMLGLFLAGVLRLVR